VINLGEDPYTVDDCVLAFPSPQHAREILDFAGYWGKERVPQRSQLGVGVHLREGRKGRTGPEAATLLHLGERGFSFSDGEIWAVHTAWSGSSDTSESDARRPGPPRLPRPHLYAYGITAPDRSTAIYTVASIGQSDVMLPGRLRVPGLNPNRSNRIRPIPLGPPQQA
jgi:Glycosyl hydrolase family 36 N-terminal domain